jgi:hypothetical protein
MECCRDEPHVEYSCLERSRGTERGVSAGDRKPGKTGTAPKRGKPSNIYLHGGRVAYHWPRLSAEKMYLCSL